MVDQNEEEDLEVDPHQAQAVEDSFLTTHTSEKARYTFLLVVKYEENYLTDMAYN